MPSLPAGTFPSTYDNNQRTSFEKNSGTGYLTTTAGVSPGGSSIFDGRSWTFDLCRYRLCEDY